MPPAHWGDLVAEKVARHGELVVGIDPVREHVPAAFDSGDPRSAAWLERYVAFLLDTIAGHAGLVKFQAAFFEAWGSAGIRALALGIAMARAQGIGIIMDAKRGDIDSTAAAYAAAYLTPASAGGVSDLESDCLTVNPFLGPDTLEPLMRPVRAHGKGLFVLAKTSNPGSGWLQDKTVDGERVSDRVAMLVAELARETKGRSGLGAVGAVVGATYPEDGKRLRSLMPDSLLLAPGVGAQGASIENLRALRRAQGGGVLVPVSRGITKIADRAMSAADYAATIRKRIADFRTLLA
jgi:orotidine-5'-phosphate decarboxylase